MLKKIKSTTQNGEIWAYHIGLPGQKNTVLELDPLFAMIYGERSNGKSFAGAELILWDYLFNKERGVWIRKDDEAFKDPDVRALFNPVFREGLWVDKNDNLCLPEIPGARHIDIPLEFKWQGAEFKRGGWVLYYDDENLQKRIYDEHIFCYSKPIRVSESRKGGVMEQVHYCIFDEFLSRNSSYIKDETILFGNLVSTIVRYQKHARFILLANTVNKRSEYFKLFHIKPDEIEQGHIHVMKNKKGDYMAVEYVEHKEGYVKESDSYIDFLSGNRLRMIKDGSWEIADYPLMDREFRPKDVRKEFYILLDENCVKCQVIRFDQGYYIYISENNQAVDENEDIIASNIFDVRRNWTQSIFADKRFKAVADLFLKNKVLYDTLDSGEIVNEYLKFCKSYSIIKA